jgi:GNAT superfamily N-acetyltransferase
LNSIEIRLAEGEDLREPYERVLAPSFPVDELEPFDVFAEMVEDGRREVRVALDGEEVVAAGVTKELPGSGAVLLSHHATREDRRGAGYGRRLYRALLDAIVDDLEPSLVLGEVAHPDHHAAHPAYGDPVARLRFYGRFDARIIDVPYFQASLGPGLQPVYGLLLLALYVRPDLIDPARSRLDNPENLLAALRVMLQWDGEPDDFAAARLLTVASQGRVRLVPVEQYRTVVPGLRR